MTVNPSVASPTMHPVATAINAMRVELQNTYLERRPAIEAMALAILTRQHAFLFGPPGTAKSALCRDFAGRFTGATYFEQILSKTRPDQAVLGPYDLPALKDGVFKRRIDGYLLTAQFAFLDEVGKMSPTTGHDILAALNERIRHEVGEDGASTHSIPLHTCFTASNEIPTSESDDAAALWDRLLIRTLVDTIKEPGNFEAMLQSKITGPRQFKRTEVSYEDLDEACDFLTTITLPRDVVDALLTLKANLLEQSKEVSDRRWGQCVPVLQATAFLEGRDHVEVDDIHSLRFVLWEQPEDIQSVERATLKIANPLNEALLEFVDLADSYGTQIREMAGRSISDRAGLGSEIAGKLKNAMNEIDTMRQQAISTGRSTSRIDDAYDTVKAMRHRAMRELLEIDPDDKS